MATTDVVIRSPRCARAAAVAGMTALGAVLGAAVLAVVHVAGGAWAADLLAWAGTGVGAGAAVGAVAGGLFGAAAGAARLAECLQVRLTGHAVELRWEGGHAVVPRGILAGVVVAEDIVLLAAGGVELARVRNTLEPRRLRRALEAAGLPTVLLTDPHAGEFIPWDASDPLPGLVHRYLAARAEVLRRRALPDAEFLRRELLAHGIAVRDVPSARETVQQWRTLAARV